MTVPYTAMWTGESAARKPLPVRETLRGLQPLLFLSEGVNAPGEGKPMFKMLHQDRCREVIRRYGATEDDLWFHASTGSVYCDVPKPIAAPAPGISDDEAAALSAYVAAHPGC